MADPVLICLTPGGRALADRLAKPLGAQIHGRAGRVHADSLFEKTTAHIRDLFAAGRPIIGLCAAGILIRALAPMLGDKNTEAPVLSVAEDGSAIVPLLGGHRGANDLARRIGEILLIKPAITTAGDLALGVALDAPPPGWRVRNAGGHKAVAAALFCGGPVHITGAADHLSPLLKLDNVTGDPDASAARRSVTIHAIDPDGQPAPDRWIAHEPCDIVLGVGCARDCPPDELARLAQATLTAAALPIEAVAAVTSLDLKADEAAVLELASALNVPVRFFSAKQLEAETPRLANPSDIVFAEVGCHGVAEAAALASVGPAGSLFVEKQKSANATVALARASGPITQLPGRRRGKVSLIGIGPGQSSWRTPEASLLVAEADELVGYGLYIDLLGPAAIGKPRTDFGLGAEEERCRYALEQAALGRDIAMICSGDAGIYAMGALVYELIARETGGVSDPARRVEIITAPGISALQAAAARAGAPLGHDFCAISLSDLLTPRIDIERRVQAAAKGDFVIAFYNPVSLRRRDLFIQSLTVLKEHRPAETPVILARALGRPDETVDIHNLDDVTSDQVDMLTVVLVGSSQSRRVRVGGRDRVFTPRGYAAKHQAAAS